MRSLPNDNCLRTVPVDISDLIEKKVNFDESHLVNKGIHNDTLCSHKEQIRAASMKCTARDKHLKHRFSCLAPSSPKRQARAEMLKPTNGRESQAPAATLQWGPYGITLAAKPQGTAVRACWVSIQHIPNGESWDPKPKIPSSKAKVQPSWKPEPFLGSSPVVDRTWPPESIQATRVRAATRIIGSGSGSLLASLNIRTLTDAKLMIIIEWMRMSGVVAVALQETRTESGLLMDPPSGFSLFLGPCVLGSGPGGRPSRSRGCGWLVDTEWGRKVGIQFNTASTHSCTVTIQTTQGEIDLVSLYSAPSEIVTAEESEMAAACNAGRQQIWFSDSNADPSKGSAKSQAWSNLLEIAGGLVALNRSASGGSAPLVTCTLGRMKGAKTLAIWTPSLHVPRRCSLKNSQQSAQGLEAH